MQKNKDADERFGAMPVFPSQYPRISAGIANKKPTPIDIYIDIIISVISLTVYQFLVQCSLYFWTQFLKL